MFLRSARTIAISLAVLGAGLAEAASVEENKQTLVDMTVAINARDLDALDEYVAADVKRHCGATPGVVVENLEQFKAFLETDIAAVPDSVQTINFMLGEGALVAAHVTYAGTQTGAMGSFPPSGKRLEIPFIGILRFENGKIAEIWVEWDNLGALAQLGHFPPPEIASAAPGE